MKFVAVTYGTEGDTRPLAALCRALIDAGHEAHLLADAATLESAHDLGVPSTALAGDVRGAVLPENEVGGAVKKGGGFAGTMHALTKIANANAVPWMRETLASASGCDALIVGGLAAFVGFSVAEYLGIPAIGAGLIPITPTSDFGSPFIRPGTLPRCLNRPSYLLVNELLWRSFRARINAARAEVLKCGPRRKLWTDVPMLYGISPSVLPRPHDWPENVSMCGQWIPKLADWTPPTSLAAFLDAGAPPLYVGFGSMPAFNRNMLREVVLPAISGRRALLYPGWSDFPADDLPENIHVVGNTPHDWLFRHVALVVHHGGSGTSHSAVRAGVPSVVVPFAGDQVFWGECLKRAGVAPGPILSKTLSASALAGAISFSERDEIHACASELGAAMQAEDGLSKAVAHIEDLVQTPSAKVASRNRC